MYGVENFYYLVVYAGFGVYLILAAMMIFLRPQRTELLKAYHRSRRLMAIGFILCSLHLFFIFPQIDFYSYRESNTLSIDITFSYLVTILFNHTFTHLVDHDFSTLKRRILDLIGWALLAILSGLNTISESPIYHLLLTIAAALMFPGYIILTIIRFYPRFNRQMKQVERFNLPKAYRIIQWIRHSMSLLLIVEAMLLPIIFSPMILKAFFMIALMVINGYITFSFINFMRIYPKHKQLYLDKIQLVTKLEEYAAAHLADVFRIKEDTTSKKKILNEMQEGLLSMWLIEKGYREPDTTISKVAQIIHTNRSYLMQYFKQKYGMSFTTRMNQLRLEDAKQLMLENKEMTMAEIAFQIGYASGSYFTHVFSIYEGVAPARWRVEQQDAEI